MRPRTKLEIAVCAVVGVIAFGTIGFKLIEGWPWFDCFYFTLITVATIGYGEPEGMHHSTRYFTASVIIMGLITVTYALSAAAQAVIEFEFVERYGRRRMFKDISKLADHYIVCGAGRVGSRVIREIALRNVEFVVIEKDEAKADRMLANGHLVLMADATEENVLIAAGIERARGVVCALSSDPDNLYLTLTARDLNKTVLIVARANDEAALTRLQKAGANKVVSPIVTGSSQMAQMLLKPAVADVIELATMKDALELEIEQVAIQPSSPFVGCSLRETDIRSQMDVIVIAIKRAGGSMLFNPSADAVIEQGDALVAMGSHKSLEAFERAANPERSRDRIGHRH
ncbi:MAG TPA: potassium channel protein [Blastocatellia bacterium]|nr:potassium channel protein [Blastocatellia bacterium]